MSIREFMRTAVVGAAILCAATAGAQQPAPQVPTTVQLPTFSFFTVQTSVSVPDRGGAYLGGINRARDGRVERGFGPFSNRGIGGERLASNASVHARIIDFEEIDRMLLEAAARRSGTSVDPALAKASTLTKHIERAEAPLAGSIAAIKAQNAAAAAEQSGEVVALLSKAEQAEADGKPAVAKIFYQMVVRRDAGALKQRAQSRLAALASEKPAAVAQR